MNHQLFVTCPHLLEDLVFDELISMGFEDIRKSKAGVQLRLQNLEDIFPYLMKSRLASRVLFKIFDFNFKHQQDFINKASQLPWDQYLDAKKTLKITTTLAFQQDHRFKNSHFCSLLLKDAIIDYCREHNLSRPNIDTKNPDQYLVLRMSQKSGYYYGEIFLDLSGTPLSHRGYRFRGHDAPMRENMAAACVDMMKLDGSKPFYDLMCGSGTVLVEAALKLTEMPSSFLKITHKVPFTLLNSPYFQKSNMLNSYKKAKEEVLLKIEESYQKSSQLKIFGSDIDLATVQLAQKTLKRCGFDGIQVERKDFFKTHGEDSTGVIFCNPPYDQRLSQEDVQDFYYDIGEHIKHHYNGHSIYLLAPSKEHIKKVRLKAGNKFPVMNGSIECRLIRYDIT